MPQGHSVTAKTRRVPRTLRPGAVQPKPRRPAGRRARPHGGCGPSQATPPPLLAPRPRVLSVLHRASGSCRPPPHPAAWPPPNAVLAPGSGCSVWGPSWSRPVHRAQSCLGTRPACAARPPRSGPAGATCSPGNPSPILLPRLGVRSPWGSGSEPRFKACTFCPHPTVPQASRAPGGLESQTPRLLRWPAPPQ